MKQRTVLGVIGGSGLYELPGLTDVCDEVVDTPFGPPSDTIKSGQLNGKRVVFLPRHGRGHRFLPSEVNYRANIFALKKLGVNHVVSVSAVGSLKEELAPGTICIPTQILDRTVGLRRRTFFGAGVVGHLGFADPFCPELQKALQESCIAEGAKAQLGGTYVCVEGPRFSSRAESLSFRALDCAVIGMTAMPEAVLAREAEMAYATLAFVTDYDCWRPHEEAVSVEAVMAVLKKNTDASQRILTRIINTLPAESANPLFEASKFAIMTPPQLIPVETRRALDPLFGKYWRG